MRKTFILLTAVMITSTVACKRHDPESGIFTYKVGNYEVVLLSEGQGQGNTGILIGGTPEMIEKTIPDKTFPNAINAFLVKTPDKTYLIDTGLGKKLLENMQSTGISPEQVNTIIITHMHGDHIGGMLKEGKPVFPDVSEVILAETERNHWASTGNVMANNVLKEYSDKLRIIRPGKIGDATAEEGFFFFEAYGHTPGHMICLIKSAGEQLLVWADLTHAMAIQMPYPEVAVTYDLDPEMAIKSRKAVLEYVTKNKIPVAGMHIAYPAIGKVETVQEGGYKFIPAD